MFEDQVQENRNLENDTAKHDRLVAKYRSEFGTGRQATVEFQDEVDVLKNTMSKAEADLAAKKNHVVCICIQYQMSQEIALLLSYYLILVTDLCL